MAEKDDLIMYRLDELKEDIGKLSGDVNKVLGDHEQRIRALEMGRPRANGERRKFWVSVIALAGAIVTVAAALAGR